MYKYFHSTITSPEGRLRGSRDRRGAPRYPAGGPGAELSWREGQGYRIAPAQVWNISQKGALAQVTASVPHPATLWIRLCEPAATDWVEASTVVVKRDYWALPPWRRSYLVRLQFATACPYAFFREAVHGPEPLEHAPGFGSEEFDCLGWR